MHTGKLKYLTLIAVVGVCNRWTGLQDSAGFVVLVIRISYKDDVDDKS